MVEKQEPDVRYDIGRRTNGATYLVRLENGEIVEASVIANSVHANLSAMDLQVAAGTLTAALIMDEIKKLPLSKKTAQALPSGVISFERLTTK